MAFYIISVLSSILTVCLVYLAFRKGYQAGLSVSKGEPIKPITCDLFWQTTHKTEAETQKQEIIHDNIEAFGTNIPQKEVQ